MKKIVRTWITGAIYLLAFAGYLFYGILWTLRFMQTLKKRILIVFLLPLIAAAVMFYFFGPTGRSVKIVEMHVTTGTSLRSIAQSLQKSHVIRWSTALVLWMKCNGTSKRIQAGIIEFKEHEGVIAAAKQLLNALPVEYTVKVPEGLTIEQTAGIFQAALKIDSAQFVELCQNEAFIKTLDDSLKSCEGFLFPNTYRFPEKTSSADVIKKMIKHFDEAYSKLEFSQDSVFGLSKRNIVILASIVEKEAQLSLERPRIAAVFHNRLRMGMPLGADPTVRYIFKKFSGPLRVSELKSKSPYNTRVYAGLPPGPICSPGFASLQAAAAPLQSKELYFVAKWDGSGGHDFSTTYQEHNKKKDTIQRKNDRRIAREKNAHK